MDPSHCWHLQLTWKLNWNLLNCCLWESTVAVISGHLPHLNFFSFSIPFIKNFIQYLSPKELCCLYRHSNTMSFFFKSLDIHRSCDNPFAELGVGHILATQVLCIVILRRGRWNMLSLLSSEHKCNNILNFICIN